MRNTRLVVTRTVLMRCRAFQLNSKDNKGVLVGKWGGGFAGGTSPSVWNGSGAILEKFMASKQPVRYGQCWVFSGITTSGAYGDIRQKTLTTNF